MEAVVGRELTWINEEGLDCIRQLLSAPILRHRHQGFHAASAMDHPEGTGQGGTLASMSPGRFSDCDPGSVVSQGSNSQHLMLFVKAY